MTTLREWKERRPASDLKQTLEFYHSTFGYYRLVNNSFRPATFGGNEFQPSRFSVVEPAQDGTTDISLTITLQAGSQEVRQILKKWRGQARMSPISVKYQLWDKVGDEVSLKTYSVYVIGVPVGSEDITVNAGHTNPLTLANNTIYTYQQFPGLLSL
ncbi:hypothetical protein [Entomohabitans teleogrylli]|uniref:hypothetical protein n=1 Tax=Entomohabitans teleogrylli TaxID=1384589 RepID=UPI00073D3991|nr:hypothetical protein [Entomohabitans teleogrylli]